MTSKYCECTCLFWLWFSMCMYTSPLGGFTEHEDFQELLELQVIFRALVTMWTIPLETGPGAPCCSHFWEHLFSDQLKNRVVMVTLTSLVNQHPSVSECLAGRFITNLSVLISLVMWQLPKKETRKSCVTKGETWQKAAGHWVVTKLPCRRLQWLWWRAVEGFKYLPGLRMLQSDPWLESVVLREGAMEGGGWWWWEVGEERMRVLQGQG